MAEGGRIEPGRHAGTPASPTTETRRLVEDGGYAGRHEAPAPVQVADGKSQAVRDIDEAFAKLEVMQDAYRRHFGPIPSPDERLRRGPDSGEGPEGDWGPGDDDPPDYQHPDGD